MKLISGYVPVWCSFSLWLISCAHGQNLKMENKEDLFQDKPTGNLALEIFSFFVSNLNFLSKKNIF